MNRPGKAAAALLAALSLPPLACGAPRPPAASAKPIDTQAGETKFSGSHNGATESDPLSTANTPVSAQPSVHSLRVDFAFEDAVQSGSQLLLMATDGHAEIRDAAGRREREIDIGLTPLGYAVPIHDGWVAIGSLRAEVDGKEVGAAVQVHRGGTLGPTWKAPGLFRSAVARGDEVLVSDATGPVFSLKPDGALGGVPSLTQAIATRMRPG